MLSKEEWAIMQNQMVQLCDEKKQMTEQIQALLPVKQKIPILKKILQEKMTNKANEESAILSDITLLRNNVASIKRVIAEASDESNPQTWDEKRLAKKEIKYKEEISRFEKLKNIINDLKNRVQISKDTLLNQESLISDTSNILLQRQSLGSRVGPSCRIIFHLNDREAYYHKIKAEIQDIGYKINSENRAIQRLIQSNLELHSSFSNVYQKFEEKKSFVLDAKQELTSINDHYTVLKYELEALHNQIESEYAAVNSTDKDNFHVKLDKCKAELNQKNQEIEGLKQTIDQTTETQEISKQKKLGLMEQIKKKLNKIASCVANDLNSSGVVQRLTEKQQSSWIEIQTLNDQLDSIKALHKKKTDIVAHKAIVYEEIQDFLKSCPTNLDTLDPISHLSAIYEIAQKENKELAAGIARNAAKLEELKRGKTKVSE